MFRTLPCHSFSLRITDHLQLCRRMYVVDGVVLGTLQTLPASTAEVLYL